MIPSNPQSCSAASPVGDRNAQSITERSSSPHRVSHYSTEVVSPLLSAPAEMSDDLTDSEPEEEKDRRRCEVNLTESDEEETGGRRDEDDDDDDENYEEVVVKLRPLNEVTSLTDKTSPWTSIMSDPDLVSLESLETPEKLSLSEDEGKEKLINMESGHLSGKDRGEESEDHCTLNGSTGDASDSEREDEKSQQAGEELNSPNERSGDTGSSSGTQLITDTHNVSGSSDNPHLQPYPFICFGASVQV